jgi:hypothetical protein
MVQTIDVPVGAVSLRLGIRDNATHRIGSLEVSLPLADAKPGGILSSAKNSANP